MRGGETRSLRAQAEVEGERLTTMSQYALVLNAGSSSLKFSVYQEPKGGSWALAARGLMEGIGTAPRLSAKNIDGHVLVDQKPETPVRDGRDALEAVASWLKSRYGGAPVLGVGHRVVHGGPHYASPTMVTPAGHDRASPFNPAGAPASAVQSCGDRSRVRKIARRATGSVLRHQLPPKPAGRRGCGPAAA